MNTSAPRPLAVVAHEYSFSSASETIEAKALTYLLRNMRPGDLHARLLRAVDSEAILHQHVVIQHLYRSLRAIGLVTGTAEAAVLSNETRHCVRCHKLYMERDNGLQACAISHDKPRLMKNDRPSPVHPAYANRYECCDINTALDSPPAPFCFVGRHTTLERNVTYNKTSIPTCEAKKCKVLGAGAGLDPRLSISSQSTH